MNAPVAPLVPQVADGANDVADQSPASPEEPDVDASAVIPLSTPALRLSFVSGFDFGVGSVVGEVDSARV